MTYMIIRFYRDGTPAKIIKRGLSLEDAQAHCNNPKTAGDGWFDGYESEE